jgi:hypothetical protein
MALVLNDRVQQQGTANTTVSFTLTASVAGFQSFAVIGNGNTTYYSATDASGNWEVGIGTYSTTGPTLTRTTILSSSNSNTAVTFSGTVNVFVTYPSEKSINYDANDVATIGQTLGYSDTGIVGSFASTVAGYNQVIVQNKSTATNASSNLNVSNDAGTAGSNYAELGINSSTFTGTGSFNIAGASYVASASTDLTIGTYGAYSIHFVTNSNTTDAMTIYNNGGVSLGTFSNPGINNIAASKFVPGYTAVTSAAGTTVLTADSNFYQNLLGTTTQTFRLPDATTLLVGTTFIFDNDSTGVLTITDNASGTIDAIPAGGIDYLYLANNSTVAGTWRKHAFIPAAYDFNNTVASFGNASITNAVWTGTTVGTAYGGTGLTSFAAANYALYSTSSSALTAGTLPTAAGGTALTSFTSGGALYATSTSALTTGTLPTTSGGTGLSSYTTGDIIYASATNTLSKLPIGTTGQILSVAGGIPSWSSNSASTTLTNTTFTATAGQTSFSVTYIPALLQGVYRNGVKLDPTDYDSTSGSSIVLNTGANLGDNIQVQYFSGLSTVAAVNSITFGSTGLTPSTATSGDVTVAGTLGSGYGGTGFSTYATGDLVYASATNTLSKLTAGTNGYVLTLSGGVPTWAASSGGVTSFQTSLSGLTPSTSTTGAVTLAGTLGVASGGTGITSFGTGVATALGQNVTGSGGNVLSSSPTIASPTFTSQSTFAAGTAALPAITTTGDTNTGIFFPAADTIAFAEGGAEAMRLDSAGNVGIGTTSPNGRLSVASPSTAQAIAIWNRASDNTYGGIYFKTSDGATDQFSILNERAGTNGAGLLFYAKPDGGSSTEQARITSTGLFQFNSGYGSSATAYGCRAWVNFNGTGTIAIRGSGNVSSITDGGTGQYTVNFTTAMPDANYAVNLSSNYNDSSWNTAFIVSTATGSMSMRQAVFGGGYVDESIECVSIFR